VRIDPGLVSASPLLSLCTFRVATPADLEVILRHRREMFREMGGRYRDSLEQYESASRKYFEAALQDGTYFGILAELGGEIAGGGGVLIAPWPGSPLNFEAKRAWILNIYVESEHRRQGLAKALTQLLIDWCRQNGFASVALHASEYGRGLYEKLGFQRTNEMRLIL
jgi:ribosomal protein S18 acetylase RimI-like enzyme